MIHGRKPLDTEAGPARPRHPPTSNTVRKRDSLRCAISLKAAEITIAMETPSSYNKRRCKSCICIRWHERKGDSNMVKTRISKADFLADVQGKTFTDVVNDPKQPFDCVLDFFDDADRQRRMEESELHHDRAPLAGVVRELESQPAIDRFWAPHRHVAIHVFVRRLGSWYESSWNVAAGKRRGERDPWAFALRRHRKRPRTTAAGWRFGLCEPNAMNFPAACPISRYGNAAKRSAPLRHENQKRRFARIVLSGPPS